MQTKARCLLIICLFITLIFSVMPVHSQDSSLFPPMEYVDVCEKPGVCRKLSKLIMGTDHLGKIPNKNTIAVLNEAARLGINTFDTAPIYAESIEIRLGAWLKAFNRSDRSGLYVITKGGFPRDFGPGKYYSRLKGDRKQIVANVFEEIRKSRAKFADKITIYLMHRDDSDFQDFRSTGRPQVPVQTILEALSDPILRNKFVMVGVSNWDTSRVDESQRLAMEHPELVRPVCNSPYFSLLEMGSVTIHSGGKQVKHDEMMNPDFQKGVKLMTYSPLGGFSIFERGWEAARQEALALKNSKDRYWGNLYDAIFHEANEKRYYRAIEFTKKFNEKHKARYTVDQIVNAYALAHPRTDFLIIGPKTVEQLRRTVQALDVSKLLTPEDLEYLYRNP